VPLGLDRPVPEERLRLVLPESLTDRSVRFFGVDLDGIELRAEDMDWTLGSGAPLTGAAADLLLVLCGRTLPAGRLTGEPSAGSAGLAGNDWPLSAVPGAITPGTADKLP
jgi:hypothetical protein